MPDVPDTIRLLLFEDPPADAHALLRAIAATGLTCESRVVDTRQALVTALAEFRPDVVIADARVPETAGPAIVRLVAERAPAVPVIVIGATEAEEAVACLKAGAADCLATSSARLAPAITEAIVGHRRRRVQQRLVEAIEHGSEAVLVADAHGTIEYASPAWSRMAGHRPGPLAGQALDAVLGDCLDAASVATLHEALGRREAWRHRMAGPPGPEGQAPEYELLVSPLATAGPPAGFMVVCRDITQQAALEQQLRHAQKMEALGRLAGGIAHDFNNLLTAISGYSELAMLSLSADDPIRQSIVEVQKAAERAGTLTRQLLSFSRTQPLQPRILAINDVIFDVERMLRRMIGEDIALVLDLDQRAGRIQADPAQIELLLINLAVNARDAMPEGGKLTIASGDVPASELGTLHGPAVRLRVTDTGVGMTEAVRARIFEPFFTTKEPGRATGLGLSTVHAIVEQCGGRIGVTSAPGLGSTFTIDFPAVSPAGAARPVATAPPGRARGQETVLVVEDDVALRRMLVQVLGSQGYDVVEAGGADLAVARARGHHRAIDLAVVDVVLPRHSGLDVAEHLMALLPGLRVLFISGYAPTDLVRQRLASPGVSLLPKPFKPADLVARVRTLLDERPRRA